MNAISNDHVDVGAYALGLLENQDKATFEAHLATCASCTAELETMSSLAALMKGLDPVEPPGDAQSAQPPVDLLRKRAAASRRRVRWQIAVAAAACVAALGAGLGIGLTNGSQPGVIAVTGQRHMATDPATGVTGTVGLVAKAWGTQVTLDLAGVHGPVECQLIAVSKTGEQKVVTGWFVPAPGDGVPGHPAHLLVQGGTAIELGNLTRFEVTVVNGRTLLTIPV
jgi:predicted anti-sigma-YlaC factor YlaD